MSMNTIQFCVCFSAILIGLWRMNIGPEEPLDFPFEHQEDGAQAVASQHSFDCEDFSCGNDCAHHCSCSVPSRQEVGCIFCYDIAMIEQIHMDNAAICSEAGDISFSQDSRKLHKLF